MLSNPFVNAVMTPNFAQGHYIQWKLDSMFMESEPYIFTVEVSGTPDFSEIHYTLPPTESFFAVDDTNFRQAIYVDLYYRVKLETADKHTYYSKSMYFGSAMESRRSYRLASEIVRKELLRLRRYTGIDAYLLKRKAFGEVRKDEVDSITGAPITDNVSHFGTGLSGGYFKPLKVMFTYEDGNSSRTLDQAGLGVNDVNDVSLRMIGHPLVETHDVIVDTIGDARFLVKKATPTFFPGTCLNIVQKIEASQLPTTDTVYKIILS